VGSGAVADSSIAGSPIRPIARSPIRPAEPVVVRDGWEVSARPATAALTLSDVTARAKVLVKADANGAYAASSLPFGRAARPAAGRLEIGSSPGEWLHLGPPGDGPRLLAEISATVAKAGEYVSVLDLTHGGALLRLTGDDAPSLLAKICAIDLSDAVTPDLAAFRSSVAKTVTDVVRDDVGGRRSYLLHCDRSFGQYLFDCVLDAGREFGIEIAGFVD
jgi:heterotetrameric sarcosine oxidase gamma subunit